MQTTQSPTMDIGISETDRRKIAEGLSRLLADTYTLYLKSHNYHWNVTGPSFYVLHQKFEELYTALAQDVDKVAERIRALGYLVPASFSDYLRLTSIKEDDAALDANQMVESLVNGHEALIRTGRGVVKATEAAGDLATANLLTDQIEAREKTAWMLRSYLAPAAK